MSVPARDLPAAHPRTDAASPAAGQRSAAAGSSRTGRPATAAVARPRPAAPPRRTGHPVFLVFSALVVVALVVGVVALNAMVAQVAFAVHAEQTTEADLAEQHDLLTDQVAGASSPNRIARWAADQGMVVPDGVVVLRVPGVGRTRRG